MNKEWDMPTPRHECGAVVEFNEMMNHPDDSVNSMVCEDCHERLKEEMSSGLTMDASGNKLSWKSDPDCGLLEIFVNGEEFQSWSYEYDPEDCFNDFVEIWNKAQELK